MRTIAEKQDHLEIVDSIPAALRIRPMREADLPQVMAWERVIFPSPWSEEHFVSELENPQLSIALVMEWAGEFAGYAVAWTVADELHITNIAVIPKFRRRGIAKVTIQTILRMGIERGCRYALLEVRVSNRAAIALYETLGFQVIGVRKNYYQRENEDALVMTRNLQTPLPSGWRAVDRLA